MQNYNNQTDCFEMLFQIAEAQTKRFPEGDEPFKNGCRILEEAGEIIWELNHYGRKGIPIEKGNAEGKHRIAFESYQLCEVVCQLLQYFDLSDEFRKCIKDSYDDYTNKGYIK